MCEVLKAGRHCYHAAQACYGFSSATGCCCSQIQGTLHAPQTRVYASTQCCMSNACCISSICWDNHRTSLLLQRIKEAYEVLSDGEATCRKQHMR